MPDLHEQQRDRLRKAIEWARSIRKHLSNIQGQHIGRVHFRPSSGGVAMIGLLRECPQRGKSAYTDLATLAAGFDEEFDRYCRNVERGAPRPEKRLQSFLIAEAYKNGRRMTSINTATEGTEDPAVLLFATDELAVPVGDGGGIVCDVLALRSSGASAFRPVIMEIKYARHMKRLVEQVDTYASVIEANRDLFEELFSVLLGRTIELADECEKWIVWPALASGIEPREEELADKGVRVVSYVERDDGFDFQAFRSP